MFIGEDKSHFYLTDSMPKVAAPFSNTFYSVQETDNSSIKLIRPSHLFLPTEPYVFEQMKLPLGLYFQPFVKLNEDDSSIPKVESKI